MNTDQLQNRLERLERRQSWTLRAGSAAAIVLAAGALMAQVQPEVPGVPPGTRSLPLKASRFELVDEHDQTRAVLRMEAGAPVLRFHDAAGGLALRLTVRGSDGAIEYTEGGETLSLMKPAQRAHPLTTR